MLIIGQFSDTLHNISLVFLNNNHQNLLTPTSHGGELEIWYTGQFFSLIQTTDQKSPVKEIVYTRRKIMRAPKVGCSELDLIFKQGQSIFNPIHFHSCLKFTKLCRAEYKNCLS
jgi:hypothetical protein